MKLDNKAVVNLDNLTVFSHSGDSREPLNGGNYKLIFFAYQLIDKWLPFYECHKCGRGDYCKFSVALNGTKNQDRQCGVIETFIINFINSTWQVFNTLSLKEKQNYLDGFFHLQRFIYHSELNTGLFLDSDLMEGFGKHIPSLFGNTVSFRKDLNKVASYFQGINEFNAKKDVLLVEGWSEKVFIQEAVKSGLTWFRRFDIEVYEGKNNKSHKKLQLLIKKLKNDGYEIYIQGDKDGNPNNIFQDHIKSNLITESNCFQFDYDLETAFPPKLMFNVLLNLELIEKIDMNRFSSLIYPCEESVIKKLKRVLSIDLSDKKLAVADTAGKIISNLDWWNSDDVKSSEIGRFLNFLTRF